METPPSNVQARNIGYNPNYRLETPIINTTMDNEDLIKNEYLTKMNPSFYNFFNFFLTYKKNF